MNVSLKLLQKQREFLACDSRLAVYQGGLEAGKNFILCVWAVIRLIKDRHVILIEPTYQMCRDVLVPTLDSVLGIFGIIDSVKRNKSELTYTFGGGKIYLRTAENPDRMRGINAHDLGMDEASYVATSDIYLIGVGRLRLSADAQARIVGTPKGMDWVQELIEKSGDRCAAFRQSTIDNYFLPQSYISSLLEEYEGDYLRQELYAEIINSDLAGQFIPTAYVMDAQKRTPVYSGDEPIIVGVDVARMGDDRSSMVARQGNRIIYRKVWNKNTVDELAHFVAHYCGREKVATVGIDMTGVGAGVYDIVESEVGKMCKVYGFETHQSPTDGRKYKNAMAECWGEMRRALKDDLELPEDKELRDDLVKRQYLVNRRGQQELESKDKMKARGIRSPDLGESLAMTYSPEIVRFTHRKRHRESRETVADFAW